MCKMGWGEALSSINTFWKFLTKTVQRILSNISQYFLAFILPTLSVKVSIPFLDTHAQIMILWCIKMGDTQVSYFFRRLFSRYYIITFSFLSKYYLAFITKHQLTPFSINSRIFPLLTTLANILLTSRVATFSRQPPVCI